MRQFLRILSYVMSNALGQRFLMAVTRAANYVAGLGSGAGVESSGEAVVFNFLPQEPVVFDVGANRGLFAKLAFRHRPKAKVHCFEPSAHTFALLSETLKDTAAILNNFGISAKAEERMLYSDKDGSGLASLTKRNLAHHAIDMDRSEKVTTESIDRYCEQRGVDRIDLLKVDVEGHELEVFTGARVAFLAKKIGYVLFEFGGCNIDTRTYFKDFFLFFTEMGAKKIYRISASGKLIAVDSYDETYEVFFTTNYVVEL